MDKLKVFTILKFLMLILIVAGIPAYILIFQRDLLSQFRSYEDVILYMRSFKGISALVFVIAQILQVVISVLPGEVFEIAAGSLFGFPLGLLLTFIGVFLGSAAAYTIARFLGRDAVQMIVGESRMQEYMDKLNSERAYIIVFILYLLPGIPKDILCYLAGISNMRFKPFVVISSVARIPGLCGCLLFGTMYMEKNYPFMIGIVIFAGIILLICFIFRTRVMALIDRIYEKLQ